MDIKTLLKEEIERRLGSLEDVPMCTPEDKSAVEDLTKLLDKLNDMEKIEMDHLDKVEYQEKELDMKLKQMKHDKFISIANLILSAVSFLGGIGLTVWGTIKSINFEKEGTITTIMGRGFIQKLLPKK